MYTIDDLNVRLLSELKELAEGLGINAKKLGKQELVYKILDHQAANPTVENKPETENTPEPDKKIRPRRRENVTPPVLKEIPSKQTRYTKRNDELVGH